MRRALFSPGRVSGRSARRGTRWSMGTSQALKEGRRERPWRASKSRYLGSRVSPRSSSCEISTHRTLPFDELVQRAAEEKHKEFFISEDEKYYLRSLGEDPRKDVADIRKQFPLLEADIKFPNFFKKDQFFSSVFRISSSGLQLWTHYDVMDNFLIQVTGKKRVVLFSPRDAQYLYLSGTKSEVLNIDNPDLAKYPLFSKARRYECSLKAGDVLFIPALWFHNIISEEFGVGVNVFWKHLPSECYDKTDTYGNKDPTAASRAAQILDRALKTLAELPEEYKDFYARRMVLHIQDKAYSKNFE
ncbi:tRNA wybutosine-synthesizing protein 5 isoform X2 [Oryctolagus cuniculus]|uniref:tRNA wybutosine-synthesizing protein 5 isoform X2 n=1 Tax=Oryctolagus cuniculus TaxID=9986 RepID=UPI003879D633